jgi:hypothetical protein
LQGGFPVEEGIGEEEKNSYQHWGMSMNGTENWDHG